MPHFSSTTQERKAIWLLVVLWPVISCGHVDCDQGALVFRHDGTIYALNGTALGKGYPGVDPIWKDEPRVLNHRPLKVDLTPLIDLARQQCK